MKLSKLTKPELEEIFRNANFTEEEEKVFKMLSCGKTITETAQKINVCDRTVNRISKKVYEKINRLEVKKWLELHKTAKMLILKMFLCQKKLLRL